MPSPILPRLFVPALGCALAFSHAPRACAQGWAIQNSPASVVAKEAPPIIEAPVEAEPVPVEAPLEAGPAETPQPIDAPINAPAQVLGEPLSQIARRMNKSLPLKAGRVVVLKSQRTLQLFDGPTLLKTYGVALGPRPSGHKQKRGDGRTPEGEYFVCTRNAKTSAFHIFLGLSYPALPDATRGLKSKSITPRQAQLIRSRQASRSAPPWNTKLGGWVGIHGGGDAPFASRVMSKRNSMDWTAGCVAVTDREIEEISAALKVGARVSIRP